MNELNKSIQTSLIDKTIESLPHLQHNIIHNQEQTMLSQIIKNLEKCDEFLFCVAFLTESGLQVLKKTLIELEKKGIIGKIIIGNYQNFSDPLAIMKLNKFTNIEVRLNMNNNLHSKAYYFRKDDIWTMIIGSSNLTASALMRNNEWNIEFNSTRDSKICEDALHLFNDTFDKSLKLEDTLEEYEKSYHLSRKVKYAADKSYNNLVVIEPNLMQKEALKQLRITRELGNTKAMLISATGSGKTYLSAFDVKFVDPKRCLFIVHRNNILSKAKETFESIIRDKVWGIYNGSNKDEADYLFANINTISDDKHLFKFEKDYFDYIIVDEAHKTGSNQYQKVLNYFKPNFLLGMTATPERTDDFNIYELFDNNVAYEIRLHEAIDNELIVPFHYYGVTEVLVDGIKLPNAKELKNYNIETRVENILEKSNLYGYHGDKVRGLIFVSNVEEAELIAKQINCTHYKAIALSSSNTDIEREEAIKRIELDITNTNHLDFIVTVDIFNEGIDIPSINQVLLLRQTKSSIIYIQQIGRGLRKTNFKDYLVIIDFIGNYDTNFIIPAALTSNSTYDVDSLSISVIDGTAVTPGTCTMEFEKIPQKQLLDNIAYKLKKGTSSLKTQFKHDYFYLKNRLNRTPMLKDFYDNKLLGPEHILGIKLSSSTMRSINGVNITKSCYPLLVFDMENMAATLLDEQLLLLNYIYTEFSLHKRVHESFIILSLLTSSFSERELNNLIENKFNLIEQLDNTKYALLSLQNKVLNKENQRLNFSTTLDLKLITCENDIYRLSDSFKQLLNDEMLLYIYDILNLNLQYVIDNYEQKTIHSLKLFETYSRKDAFILLNQDYNAGYQISGYQHFKEINTIFIFAKFDKSSYDNELIDNAHLVYFSKKNRSLKDPSKVEYLLANNLIDVKLFVKREGKENLYFIGGVDCIDSVETTHDNSQVVKYIFRLKNSLPDHLYKYLDFTE